MSKPRPAETYRAARRNKMRKARHLRTWRNAPRGEDKQTKAHWVFPQ